MPFIVAFNTAIYLSLVWHGDCHPDDFGGWDYCREDCPCSSLEGDCDNDNECVDGATCVEDQGYFYGFHPDVDVCIGPNCCLLVKNKAWIDTAMGPNVAVLGLDQDGDHDSDLRDWQLMVNTVDNTHCFLVCGYNGANGVGSNEDGEQDNRREIYSQIFGRDNVPPLSKDREER